MKVAHFRLFNIIVFCLFFLVTSVRTKINDDPQALLVYFLLGVNLILIIGYCYLLAKGKAWFFDESGHKPIGLFGKPKLLLVFLLASIIYFSVLIILHQPDGFSYFPFSMAYLVFLALIMILNSAFDDKMLINQQEY